MALIPGLKRTMLRLSSAYTYVKSRGEDIPLRSFLHVIKINLSCLRLVIMPNYATLFLLQM